MNVMAHFEIQLCACILTYVTAVALGATAQERYDQGKKAMAAGDLPGALEHFHFACGS